MGAGEHHFLYGKVFCGECGAPFVRKDLEDEGWRLLQSLELPGTAEGSEREWLPLQVDQRGEPDC